MTNQIMNNVVDELHAIVAALVGGARYGIKIRLPHALIMTMLFRRDLTSSQKVKSVLKLAFEHAANLGAFATVYKTILAALKWTSRHSRHLPKSEKTLGKLFLSLIVDGPFSKETHLLPASIAGHPERPYHALVAGAVGGYFVWGRYSSVNHQIVLYLTSRVIVGLAKHTWEQYHGVLAHPNSPSVLNHPRTYPLLAASVWGLVMVLFEESPHVLHKSLKQSMDEIYRFRLSSMISSVDTSSEGSRS